MEDLFQELSALVESEQYEAANHICDRIKSRGLQDADVQRMKIFCLIQRKMWNQALFQIRDLESSGIELPYEKSYCLYRMNNFEKALECLEQLGNPLKELKKSENRAICHLKAQILYRLGRFTECNSIYSELKQTLTDNSQEELEMLEVNHLAVLSSLDNYVNNIDDFETPEFITDSFEYWFNRCCLYISNKDYDNALTALEMSESIYNSSIESDNMTNASSEANPSDLCSFMVMRAFILQQFGDVQSAKDIYKECLEKFGLDGMQIEPSMIHLGVSVFNNMNSISKNQNHLSFIDGLKRLSIASKENIEYKMTMKQNFIISLNKALMSFDKCESGHYIKEATKYSNGDLKLELFKISIYLLQGKTKKALSHVDFLHKKFPEDLSISISLITILLKLKNINIAQNITDSITVRFSKSFFDLEINPNSLERFLHLLVLVTFEKYSNSAPELIRQKLIMMLSGINGTATSKYCEMKLDNHTKANILCIFGNFLIKWGLYKEATECFSFVMNTFDDTNNNNAITGYVTALTLSKSQVPNSLIRRLTNKLPSHIFSMDAEILDGSDFFSENITKHDPSTKEHSNGTEAVKKRKKRKPRYPKGFNPDEPGPPPDPDRWLPKEERASFKKLNKNSKRGKRCEKEGGHQGAITTESSSSVKSAPSTAKKAVLTGSNVRRSNRRKKR
ncbi:signal recognition particle 72 kDa (SRP72) [Cryptosporidium bovis]|uniref:signal recognition particle 72 kDa (SRP72) n=1 Tax=Cryptosporidium bovis TaxID=310047 RepID=UPI00351AA2F6|nr:signal recognition particle 72 kDa (SRP72) [Cryptosporidium bovis]